jgi:hypothetical protein
VLLPDDGRDGIVYDGLGAHMRQYGEEGDHTVKELVELL